ADRYSYISYFGSFFIAGSFYVKVMSGIPSWVTSFKPVIPFIALSWFIYFGITARTRCEVWKDSETLWRDVIEKQPEFSDGYNNLGIFLNKQGKYDEAVSLFTKTISLRPDFALPYSNRGEIYRIQGKNELAMTDLNKAIALNPKNEK